MDTDFQRELAAVLNRHSIDSVLNMPDFIIARMVSGWLENLHRANADTYLWKKG